jgi:cobalt-precorrin 5A hydrolase/precorrin-3B C17-methyltransferase
VVAISVTRAGATLAARLPFEHRPGPLAEVVPALWPDVDGLVLFAATGIVVRLVAPLLEGKGRDPAVVTVDEAGRYAIALVGGHAAGANDLAREVAGLLGAEPVVTTASDAAGLVGVDQLPGCTVHGPIAGAGRALLDGAPLVVDNRCAWPLDASGCAAAVDRSARPGTPPTAEPVVLAVDDRACGACSAPPGASASPGTDEGSLATSTELVAHPPSLVVGVGCASDAEAADVAACVGAALETAGLSWSSVAALATIDRRVDHPALVALGVPVVGHPADVLAAVPVPHPSEVVRASVGTPSVAEAAAIASGGPDAELVVPKTVAPRATAAVVRRRAPAGRLLLVGLGPGGPAHRTAAAVAAVRQADVVIGYGPYVDQCQDLLRPGQEAVRSPIGAELNRARQAVELARAGRTVAVVCSGDSGIFAMASPVLETLATLEATDVAVSVVPGVTAATAAAAALGAPLAHDHALISLSDLLTPWEVIERRLAAVAAADMAVALYNPRSSRRRWQLDRARAILLAHRPPTTPVGIVTDVGRDGQRVERTTLGALDPDLVSMTSCVVVGASTTGVTAGWIVTPRGYLAAGGPP